jgi:hypothetical protein
MPSPKEQCFKDALDAYKDAFPDKDPKVELFKQWYREPDGTWYKADFLRSFSHWIGSILRTRRIEADQEASRAPDEPNPVQWRTPDLTASDGKVYDLKFTNAKGNVDPWGSRNGMGGKNQEQDYKDINKQTDPNSGALSLDKDSCKCSERGEPQPVRAPAPAMFGVPGVNPRFGARPGMVEEAPGGFGTLEPAFP